MLNSDDGAGRWAGPPSSKNLGGDAIGCDTGGTTFAVGPVRDGNLVYRRGSWLGRRWIGHTVAMVTNGCSRRSIAWVDSGGLLLVGPDTAGLRARGVGEQPTFTDAGVVVGYLDPRFQCRPHGARSRRRPALG